FSIRVNGYVLFTNPGEYTIYLRADDTNYFVIDTPEGTQSANHNWVGGSDVTLIFNVSTPGYYPFDNVMVEQGGGDWGDISITGPGIPQRVALGDVDAGSPKIFTMKLNPADTDNDFLPDWWEEQYANNLTDLSGLDDSDFDEDTLTDFDEFENGTDPTEEDTDADGLEDGVETNTGSFVSVSDTGTDPLKADTDSDGLNDGAEVFTHDTNPHIADGDGDGFSDGVEVNAGTDPNNEDSVPGLVVVDLSFPPIIGGPGAGQDAYEPNFEEPGLTFQESHYPVGVLQHNNTDQNYDRIVVNPENWPATRSVTTVQPYADHGTGGFQTPSGGNRPWTDGGGDHFAARINGYVLLKQAGTYTIHLGADDTNYFTIDTQNGRVTVKHNCCPQDVQGTFIVTEPGYYPFDNVFCEEGGGDWFDVSISGPGIPQRVALGDVDAGSPKIFTISLKDIDTDNDLLPDWWENQFADDLTALNGLDESDFDEDGLTDFDEFENGTNPAEEDTDGDGLADAAETNTGTFVSASNTGTDPTNTDSDGDGLADGAETATGVFVSAADTGSDPNNADSDGDLVTDGDEVNAGSNPNDSNDAPADPIVLGVGTFALLGGDLTDPENDGSPDSNLNYNAIFNSSEEAGFAGGEFAFNVFDNSVGGGNEKWCCGGEGGNFPAQPIWVSAAFEQAYQLTHFTISSANDTPARDPRVWEIQGSNDGLSWETIFRQDDPNQSIWGTERNQVIRFNAGTHFATPDSYSEIRFICFATGLTDGARYQLAELEFFGEEGGNQLEITAINYDVQNDEISLTWLSRENKTYSLFFSQDLLSFDADIDDSIPAGAGETTTFTFSNPIPNTRKIFFKVYENDG
ncbi:MAG: PA14 domain-containing protein, partial [Verrucomicrobiota bacterium]|nr:PA14 domain-containing protein [Verrucomicrobiota bacterium]